MEIALNGVRILDLSQYLAGPYATHILADLGADIIKIEPIDLHPDVRRMEKLSECDEYSAPFLAFNRNKKSVALNLKTEEGKKIFHQLVKVSDVVFDNFRPDVLERLGADYQTLRKINPKIICCSVPAFGSEGPWKDRPAFDLILQSISGMISLNGVPGGDPMMVGFSIADLSAGIYAAHGILAALYRRERTGVGQKVETSMLASTLALLIFDAAGYLQLGQLPEPKGRINHQVPAYGIFKTSDSYITVAAHRTFDKLCRVLGHEELLKDPRFDTMAHRTGNRKILMPILDSIFQARTTAEWLKVLQKDDIPCTDIYTFDKTFSSQQLMEQDMIATYDYVRGGQIKAVGNPIKMSETPPEIRKKFISPPMLGQHTEEVLSGLLKYSGDKLQELERQGVVKTWSPEK